MESKSPSLIAVVVCVAIFLSIAMAGMGPGSRMSNGWQYLTTGSTSPQQSGLPAANASGNDYHQLARQDAMDNGIDPTLFERQINQESAWNPDAVSRMGAIGIAQIMPSTATGWHVDPHDPVASLQAAAKAMAWYQNHYGSFEKALACYNAGTDALDRAMAQYGADWRVGLPSETQHYIHAIVGY
jgi:soluble lytic murein transglycosylase-like protein